MSPIWQVVGSFFTNRRKKIAKEYLHGDILDIGCGDIGMTQFLDEDRYYVGVDCNAHLIDALKLRFKASRFEFVKTDLDIERIPLEHKFNTILMLAFIEHAKNPENVLVECRRLLKDDGTLVLTTPTVLGDRMLQILVNLLNPSSKGEAEREHFHIYSESDLRILLERFGFSVDCYQKFEFGGNQLCIAH